MGEHQEFKAILADMGCVFQRAAAERKKRPDFKDDDGIKVPEWVLFERENVVREERGLDPVSAEAVAKVEQMACGHVDYSTKYPLYCAELAVGRNVVP